MKRKILSFNQFENSNDANFSASGLNGCNDSKKRIEIISIRKHIHLLVYITVVLVISILNSSGFSCTWWTI